MTRYFEVKVKSCMNCPHSAYARCYHPEVEKYGEQAKKYDANHSQLTNSCPMWDKTKEDKD